MAYKDNVWAILGTIDGANSHIAIRVALKAEMVDDEHRRHRPHVHRDQHPLGDAAASATTGRWATCWSTTCSTSSNCKRVGIIRSSNRYGRFGVREIRDGSRRLGRPIVIEMAYKVGSRGLLARN